jgi:hypothetical protein
LESKDEEHCTKWRETIIREIKEMKNNDVWKIINAKHIPDDRRCIKYRLIFKLRNSTEVEA